MKNDAKITLNGEQTMIELPMTVSQLIEDKGLNAGRIAVEINEDILPKGLHEITELTDGDVVEIIQAIGGG